jgi:hypothetical protein
VAATGPAPATHALAKRRRLSWRARVPWVLVVVATGRPATWLRRVLAPTMRDRSVVVYGVVALALLLILLAGPTEAQRIFPLLILLALFAGTEVLRWQTMREFPAAGGDRAAPVP